MAALVRYVNTASTVGTQDGTTNTPGSSGTAAFATLRQFADSLPGTLTDQYTVYCEGSTDDTGDVNQTCWDMTTSATNYIHIIGEQSPLHPNFSTSDSGKWTAGKYILTATNRNTFYNNLPSHMRVEGLQIENIENDAGGYIGFKLANLNQTAADADLRASYIIVKGTRTSGGTIGLENRPMAGGAGGTVRLTNFVVYGFNTGAEGEFAPTEMYNGTIAKCVFGVVCSAAGGVLARNVIVSASSSIDWVDGAAFHANCRNNTSTDGTHPGTNGQTGTPSFVNTGAGTEDYHLQSGDTVAKNNGMTDPASGFFSDDIDGGTRSGSWDIGADEEGVTGGPPPPPFLYTLPHRFKSTRPNAFAPGIAR